MDFEDARGKVYAKNINEVKYEVQKILDSVNCKTLTEDEYHILINILCLERGIVQKILKDQEK